MATESASYEVDWQLQEDRASHEEAPSVTAGRRLAGPGGPELRSPHHAGERLQQVARFSGLLAEADAAAVVACRGQALVVEKADGATAALAPGTHLTVHPSSGSPSEGAIAMLLSGRLRWCTTVPPVGFKYASLVCAPSLSPSGRLLLLANRERHLTPLNLRLVGAYLAQLRFSPPVAASWSLGAKAPARVHAGTLFL